AGVQALDSTTAVAVAVRPAAEVCAEIGPRRFLHAGPPIEPGDVVGPARGAILGALVFEGEAPDVAAAATLLDGGGVSLLSCHEVGGVGAMAGVVCPHMPVVVVETGSGRRTFAPVNEGLGKALRFGAHDDGVLARLGWLRDVAAPLLAEALAD